MVPRAWVLILALAAGSCSMFGEEYEEEWQTETLEKGPPRRDLFQLIQYSMVQAELPPGQNDIIGGRATSGWDVHLDPYSDRGYRERAVVEVILGGEPGAYELRVRVERQLNAEKHLTLEEEHAEWEETADNPVRARVVLQQILAQLRA